VRRFASLRKVCACVIWVGHDRKMGKEVVGGTSRVGGGVGCTRDRAYKLWP